MKRPGRSTVAAPARASCCLAILQMALLLGCASPGPPHAPSLNLPKPPNDLSARRTGDSVELRFTAPSRSTDNLPLKPAPLHIRVCRQPAAAACSPVPTLTRDVLPSKPGAAVTATLTDTLPPELAAGPPRRLQYRVELLNPAGRGAGWSEPATTAAGPAPVAVEALRAEGSRLGVLLQWKPAEGDVVLQREDLTADAAPARHTGGAPANTVRLAANGPGRTLDTTAKPDTAYRYTAVRTQSVTLGGRTIELRSAPSSPVPFTLHLVYPPPAPTGLTAVGFAPGPDTFAVDLIWQPVDDTGLLAPLAGYNLYRAPADGDSATRPARTHLNAAPLPVPAFHDTTAAANRRYLYSVTAVDARGNESPAATATLGP